MPGLSYKYRYIVHNVDFDNQCYIHNGYVIAQSKKDSYHFNLYQDICKLFTNYHDHGELQAQLARFSA